MVSDEASLTAAVPGLRWQVAHVQVQLVQQVIAALGGLLKEGSKVLGLVQARDAQQARALLSNAGTPSGGRCGAESASSRG